MRPHHLAKIRKMREFAVAMEQRAAEFLFEKFDGARKRRLRHIAFLGGAGEIQLLRHRKKIAYLVHLHGKPAMCGRMSAATGGKVYRQSLSHGEMLEPANRVHGPRAPLSIIMIFDRRVGAPAEQATPRVSYGPIPARGVGCRPTTRTSEHRADDGSARYGGERASARPMQSAVRPAVSGPMHPACGVAAEHSPNPPQ
jgi:hypothetical protein